MNSKIIAVDFDGTLAIPSCFPKIGEPNNTVINYILEQQRQGAKIILWTCRMGTHLKEAVLWCAEHGIAFDAINENVPETKERFTELSHKVFAHEYIDDMAFNPNNLVAMYSDNKICSVSWEHPAVTSYGDSWVIFNGVRYIREKG